MPESEPSAPLPDAHAGCKPALYDNALDAAIERAERAERGRDDFKGLAATAADWLQSTRRDLDQARAQLAKVREVLADSDSSPEVSCGGMGVFATGCYVRDLALKIRATLGPVGATEDAGEDSAQIQGGLAGMEHRATNAEAQLARIRAAIRGELHHAADNGHHLDRSCQGVGPGERVPAVRSSNIEAALGGTSTPADPCRGGCGPGYRYGDDGCRHTTEAKP